MISINLYWRIDCSVASESTITPEHEITINRELENSDNPSWKILWDQARFLVRNNRLVEAKVSYQALIRLKPHIVAASWEYCKLLINLKEWDSAAPVIEGLLDYEPNNLQFLLAAGKVALENSHFKKSTQHYGQVLETDPVGIYSGEAILGLVKGLRGLNNDKSGLVLLEQYFQRGNSEDPVLIELAQLSRELSYYSKARHYYSILESRYPENRTYLYNLAEIEELSGDLDAAAVFWQKYLKLDQNYIPFHKKIAHYYLEKNRVPEALVHLKKIHQLDLSPELSLQIADLYFEKQKRADKALLYYEQYLKSSPGNTKIAKRVTDIRLTLARNYLPIVENSAVDNLWLDLDYITLEKEKIFYIIADLLQNAGKTEFELLVVQTLFEHSKKDDLDLAYRLAELQRKAGNLQEAYELFVLLERNNYWNSEYLRAKAENEIALGRELQALNTYQKYLRENTENSAVIGDALELGGNLGLVNRVNEIWQDIPMSYKTTKSDFKLRQKYIEALTKCGFYTAANRLSSALLYEFGHDNKKNVEIYYQLVDSLVQRGIYFNAEQLLRQNLARNMDADGAIGKLVHLSIAQKRFEEAREWLQLLAKRKDIESLEDNLENLPDDIHFLYIELLIAEGEYDDAEEAVINHTRYLNNSEHDPDFKIQSDVNLMRIFFFQEEYDKCLSKIEELRRHNYNNDEMHVISSIIRNTDKEKYAGLNNTIDNAEEVAFSAYLERGRLFAQYGRDAAALDQINSSLEKIPQSLTAMIRKVNTLSSLSRYEEAIDVVKGISAVNPDEDYFSTVKLKLQFQGGQFDTIVKKIPIKAEDSLMKLHQRVRFRTAMIPIFGKDCCLPGHCGLRTENRNQ